MKIYSVGGSVRDSFLEIKSNDIDYAVEAPSYTDMKEYITTLGYKILYEKPEYLTIKAKIKDAKDSKDSIVDFVLCRKEGCYRDNRHPSFTQPGTIYDDLSRRDFTMNSIAIDISTKEIIDPYNGRNDIEKKLIRCVGNTEERIKEDPLRLLRAIRFHITFGFHLSEEIKKCLGNKEIFALMESISTERIAQELTKCFEKDSYFTLKVLGEYPELCMYLCKRVVFKVLKK